MDISFSDLLLLWFGATLIILFAVLLWRRHPIVIRGEVFSSTYMTLLILFGLTKPDSITDWWVSLEFSTIRSATVLICVFASIWGGLFVGLLNSSRRQFLVLGLGPAHIKNVFEEEILVCDPSATGEDNTLLAEKFGVKATLGEQAWSGHFAISFKGERSAELAAEFLPALRFRLQGEPFSFLTRRTISIFCFFGVALALYVAYLNW
jgi:hypothetical protein